MFKKIFIDFDIPEELEVLIDDYIKFLNNPDDVSDDYFRTEISLTLNWCHRQRILDDDKIKLLRDYYVHRGVLKNA